MYFQSIDDKQECVGVYCNGNLQFHEYSLDEFSKTWKYSKPLKEYETIEYAQLYAQSEEIFEACPESLKQDNIETLNNIKAFIKSLKIAKVDLKENCIFDLIPHNNLKTYLELKNTITKHVFNTHEKPLNYDHLLKITKMIEDIKSQEIKINYKALKKDSFAPKARNFLKNKNKFDNFIRYRMFSTKTGRLSSQKRSFPILTLDKDLRKYIEPTNDVYLELDFNAAEIRTFLALNDQSQPDIDIHDWNIKNIFNGSITRPEAKKRIFAWLYNPNSKDHMIDKFYNRDALREKFWDGEKVSTPFHREILSDEFHSVNYILQSTSSDIFLEQAYKVFKMLQGWQSKVAFLMHDSITIDFARQDFNKIYEIATLFENTRFGKFKTNVQVGNNFGQMKDFTWKR